MTQYNIDPTKPQQFGVSTKFLPEYLYITGYCSNMFDELKKQVGMELYSVLEQMTSPCVVDIVEYLPEPKGFFTDFYFSQEYLEARITVNLTPVQYRDVVFYRSPALPVQDFLRDYHPKPEKFIDKLKYLFGKSK